MKPVDKLIRLLRVRRALPHIPAGRFLLDVGCHDGYLIKRLRGKFHYCVGIDPQGLYRPEVGGVRSIQGHFPQDLPPDMRFDCITMLAVVEHLPEGVFHNLPALCNDILAKGGKVVITQPAVAVDWLLWLLDKVRLIAADVQVDAHNGMPADQLLSAFAGHGGFSLEKHRKFELGLNNLMVFKKV